VLVNVNRNRASSRSASKAEVSSDQPLGQQRPLVSSFDGDTWVFCAHEGETCYSQQSESGPVGDAEKDAKELLVRFGVADRWVVDRVAGAASSGFACDQDSFAMLETDATDAAGATAAAAAASLAKENQDPYYGARKQCWTLLRSAASDRSSTSVLNSASGSQVKQNSTSTASN